MSKFKLKIRAKDNLNLAEQINASMELNRLVAELKKEFTILDDTVDGTKCELKISDAEGKITTEQLENRIFALIPKDTFTVQIMLQREDGNPHKDKTENNGADNSQGNQANSQQGNQANSEQADSQQGKSQQGNQTNSQQGNQADSRQENQEEDTSWQVNPKGIENPFESAGSGAEEDGIIDEIHALVGCEEFKKLADELITYGDQFADIPNYFKNNTYLFSIDSGYGLTTDLSLFAKLLHSLGLADNEIVAEMDFLIESSDEQMLESMKNSAEKFMRNNKLAGVICVDLSDCYGSLNKGIYREILKICANHGSAIMVFRIPFVEDRVRDQVKELLNDLFFVHTVTFTPFDLNELFTCAKKSANEFGYTMDESMQAIVSDMISNEKSDGRFYGIKTINKIVSELIYENVTKQDADSSSADEITTDNFTEENGIDGLNNNNEVDHNRPADRKNALVAENFNHTTAVSDDTKTAEEQLAELIGMESVAEQVNEIVSLMEYAKQNGNDAPSLHMRFVGPPGTGKTTVARLVGKILKEHNILRTGVFFEYSGNDLVAKYVGHTSTKTAQICRDAYGGVLFIDEAYSLAYERESERGSFKEEAMNTLLAQMENHRDDMVVILAGYENEIDSLLSSNPGLAQRVPYVVRFEKYSKEQLAEIFFLQADKSYNLSDEFKVRVREYFTGMPNNFYYSPTFSNARFVRNLYERVISKAAMRQRLEKAYSRTLEIEDFDKAAEDIEATMTGSMIYGKDGSGAQMFSEQDATIGFDDVCGEEEAKELLAEMIDFLKNDSKYKALGAELPKGALLYGPPGTGKTMLVRAAAGEAKVPVLSISGSDLIGKFVGEGPEKIRKLFKEARKMKPCIIFIDEIDAIGKSRNAGGSGDTLVQLLTEMDGFASESGIMILAATNQPQALDPALRRPGRLDREIPVELPGLEGRMQILSYYLKNKPVEENIDLHEVANLAAGMAGADLKNAVNEAALMAVREHRSMITQADLEESIEIVAVGYRLKSAVLSPKEKWVVCYHEIGHALAAALQTNSAPVKKITVLPRTGGALGYAMQLDPEERYLQTKTELENRIVTIVAGRAAEEVHFNEVTTGASNDIEKATAIARRMVTIYGMSDEFDMVSMERVNSNYLGSSSAANCSEETAAAIDKKVVEIVRSAHQKAIALLKENEKKLDELAEFIYEKETITGDQFMEILRG